VRARPARRASQRGSHRKTETDARPLPHLHDYTPEARGPKPEAPSRGPEALLKTARCRPRTRRTSSPTSRCRSRAPASS
jgi:hypothetical protein